MSDPTDRFFLDLVLMPLGGAMVEELVTGHGFARDKAQAMFDQLPGHLVTDVMKRNPGLAEALAEIAVEQLFGYVAASRRGIFAPSKLVDDAWECFMLRSHEYMAFGTVYFGGYLHHVANDLVGYGLIDETSAEAAMMATMAAMRELGPVKEVVWKTKGGCNGHLCLGDSEEHRRRSDAA